MASTTLISKTKMTEVKVNNGVINNIITPKITYPNKFNTHIPYVVCSFTNEGSNFSAHNITSGYKVDVLSRKISVGVYEFDIKITDSSSVITLDHILPQASILNAATGSWNKRCISYENWGVYNGYHRVRIITTDAGNNKRVETHVMVTIVGRTSKI